MAGGVSRRAVTARPVFCRDWRYILQILTPYKGFIDPLPQIYRVSSLIEVRALSASAWSNRPRPRTAERENGITSMQRLLVDSVCILLLAFPVTFMVWAFWNFCIASGKRKSRFPSVTRQVPVNTTHEWRSSGLGARPAPWQAAPNPGPLRTVGR